MTVAAPSSADGMLGRMVDKLAEQVHPREETLSAFRKVPRHLFLPDVDLDRVYGGSAIPTKHDEKGSPISSSSEVAIMALMLDALRLEQGQRVLEIGTGTGYNAAILAELVGVDKVVTVELDPEIAGEARSHLRAAGYEALRVEAADGWTGWSDGAPYARIELTAATWDISPHWVEQLEEGGVLVAPLLLRANAQAMVVLRRNGDTLESVSVFAGGFMWLRGRGGSPDQTQEVGGWRVTASRVLDPEGLVALLRETPKVELAEPVSYSDLSLLNIIDENSCTLSRKGNVAYSSGIVAEDGRGLALFEWTGGVLSPRMLLISYGAPDALDRLRRRLDEVRGRALQGLRIVAVPSGSHRPDGDVVFERANYTFAVSTKR
ncbi:MAG TPA: rRNA adenine N-6-methyltransferase family protein [Candidatus Limnocylindria bacterium]|nr:rRNA adenine N-6-methyltransferase family protein [Candidatus Limnocylindria bacterium]